MEYQKCPHCGKELTPPLFRFCNHCYGSITDYIAKYKKKEPEKQQMHQNPDNTNMNPLAGDIENSPLMKAVRLGVNTGDFHELRKQIKGVAQTELNVRDKREEFFGKESLINELGKDLGIPSPPTDEFTNLMGESIMNLVKLLLDVTLDVIIIEPVTTETLENLLLCKELSESFNASILLGFTSSFLSSIFYKWNQQEKAEIHEKLAIKAFTDANDTELVEVANKGYRKSYDLEKWIGGYRLHFREKQGDFGNNQSNKRNS